MKTRTYLTAARLLVSLLVATMLCGCTLLQGQTPLPQPDDTVVTHGILFDDTGSAQATDIIQLTKNEAIEEIQRLPVGQALVVSGFTADVTVACNPLTISITKQNNPQQEKALRASVVSQFASKFEDYTDCLAKQGRQGHSEIFGGISDFFNRHPDVTQLVAMTDGCENVATRDLCSHRKQLVAKGFAARTVAHLDPALVPRLDSSVQIHYVGIGRGTGLLAPAQAALEGVWSTWTAKTRATFTFDSK